MTSVNKFVNTLYGQVFLLSGIRNRIWTLDPARTTSTGLKLTYQWWVSHGLIEHSELTPLGKQLAQLERSFTYHFHAMQHLIGDPPLDGEELAQLCQVHCAEWFYATGLDDYLRAALANIPAPIDTFVDLGAGYGAQSTVVLEYFPFSQGVLVEKSPALLGSFKQGVYARRAQVLKKDFFDRHNLDIVDLLLASESLHFFTDMQFKDILENWPARWLIIIDVKNPSSAYQYRLNHLSSQNPQDLSLERAVHLVNEVYENNQVVYTDSTDSHWVGLWRLLN